MSPLARSLLALAAAALLHAAASDPNCVSIKGGSNGFFGKDLPGFHLDQTDSVTDLPADQCGSLAVQVGVVVTACDPYGAAPTAELLDKDKRVHVTCAWTDGQLCPQGIDVSITQRCLGISNKSSKKN